MFVSEIDTPFKRLYIVVAGKTFHSLPLREHNAPFPGQFFVCPSFLSTCFLRGCCPAFLSPSPYPYRALQAQGSFPFILIIIVFSLDELGYSVLESSTLYPSGSVCAEIIQHTVIIHPCFPRLLSYVTSLLVTTSSQILLYFFILGWQRPTTP